MIDLNDIANLIAITAIIPLIAFIYYYGSVPVEGRKHLRKYSNRWRSTSIGRTLMYQKLSWVGFLVFVLVNLFTDEYAAQDAIRVIVYGLLITLFWRVFFNLRKLQKSVPDDQRIDERREGLNSAAGSQTKETEVVVDIHGVVDSDKN